jgi:hypothetical protein
LIRANENLLSRDPAPMASEETDAILDSAESGKSATIGEEEIVVDGQVVESIVGYSGGLGGVGTFLGVGMKGWGERPFSGERVGWYPFFQQGERKY